MRIGIEKKKSGDVILGIFLIFFAFLFVFQKVLTSNYDELAVMAVVPFICMITHKRVVIYRYVFPVMLMFICILLWSTSSHSSFIYYAVMVEMLIFIQPSDIAPDMISKGIKIYAVINAVSVIVERLFPGLMISYIRILFSAETAVGYSRSIEQGYYSGINYQVAFTAAYIVFGIFMYLFDRRSKSNMLIIAFLLAALFLTNKRAHLLYMIVSVLVVYYASGSKNKRFKRALEIFLLIFVFGVSVYFIASAFRNIKIFERILSLFSVFEDEQNFNNITTGRAAIYDQLIDIFNHSNKTWGIGWQNFALYSVARSISGGINQGHNVFLQLLCETGYAGLAVFVSLNLYYVISTVKINNEAIRFYREEKQDEPLQSQLMRKCSMAFMVFYYLFWLSGNPLYDFTFVYSWILSIMMSRYVRYTMFQYQNSSQTKPDAVPKPENGA